ncbi:MAG: DUF4249 domain-containing protein [Bacteroidales bacterium]|nr:DUF4249 domain-containing protein [Bacteroidales bacterium]
MRVSKFHIILLFLLACASCIEPFEPEIREEQELMVIEGMISDKPGIHQVIVSKSAPYNHPDFVPVNGCVVVVEDNEGNMEVYDLVGNGVYEAWLTPPFLAVEKSYSVRVETPERGHYRSDFDTLLACPPVDSVYYMEKSSGGAEPDITYRGIQFYNDVRGTRDGARNFRWISTATWEYKSPFTAQYVWNRDRVHYYAEDTVSTCYLTETIQTVYAASTRFLTENSIYQNKLQYVSDQTPRMSVRYSLIVEQHSLSDQAYTYWEKLSAQSAQSASFYETQPSSTEGNMYNVYHSAEKVLGCFYAAQIQGKRIFVENQELDFPVMGYTCTLDTIENFSSFVYDNYYYLFSLAEISPGPPWLTAGKKCFDCTKRGGYNDIPEFW